MQKSTSKYYFYLFKKNNNAFSYEQSLQTIAEPSRLQTVLTKFLPQLYNKNKKVSKFFFCVFLYSPIASETFIMVLSILINAINSIRWYMTFAFSTFMFTS